MKLEKADYLKMIIELLVENTDLRIETYNIKTYKDNFYNRFQRIKEKVIEQDELEQIDKTMWKLLNKEIANYLNISGYDADLLITNGGIE